MSISVYLEEDSYLPGYLVMMGARTPKKKRLNIILGLTFAKDVVQKVNEQNKQNITDQNCKMKTSAFDMYQPTLNGLGSTRKDIKNIIHKKEKK